MKKYLYIFKSELINSLQYTFDFIIGFISYIIMIFIFLNLWQFIYSDPSEVINGYTMNQMIWYVILTEIIWMSSKSRLFCNEICDDVRSGNITYNIIKPYNYIEYRLFGHLGSNTLRFFLIIIVGMSLGLLFLHSFPELNILSIIGVLLSCFLALIINDLIIIFFGLISFFIEDAKPFYWIYSKLILVVGTIFPIEFFPMALQPIIKYSPVFVVSYGPAKLFVDFSLNMFLKVISAQTIYLIICFIIVHLIYRKGVRRINVNGG